MKKIISLALVLLMVVSVFAVASCKKDNKEYVAIDATDLLQEDFGIAVKKNDTAMKNAVDEVINEWVASGKMQQYIDYYTDLADYEAGAKDEAPEAGDLKTSWNFGNGGTITVYTESGFAPFEFLSGNNIIGVDIAIMSEVAERLGKSIDIQDVVFDTIPQCVKTATGDAVGAAGLTINDERKEAVDFSAVYYSSTLVIVSAKENSYTKLADLSGLTVGVQEGTSGDIISTNASSAQGHTYTNADEQEVTLKVSIGEISRYKQYALAFEDLKNGRIDAIVMDKLPALTMLNLIG
ncbi:MAG: transporter substrate-binding domain-containing protein [Clostridia bacterium]|nr:transporter substrate-binding domain-containing protein [Clostridia bacterium]